ncbi:alkylated DNA repair dioxygenase [Mesorhizobium sp. Root552]|jgi:alkylated DNA repair protein (DNA oxidative demethylase)|uniref:alpha-ketoglutarate-dependent dioxygenase AlkB family protein n=1 Tax=Mesorhizobium sp. Root552 TaxID=1736555 RepID=UPI0006F21DA2|nr:alpha-ketoglutarate-dependent dioxygenase AlkB [Mesorhizobium sp. Root552]KQZ19419.1 alkylated DNA repair dioxygenase [Mesorhizobium sp. Root552]
MASLPDGVRHLPGFLSPQAQAALVADIRTVVEAAPLYVPAMPKTGKEMSVRMTNCGTLGWVTDKERGYRYQPTHPVTGAPWPPIPAALMAIWQEVADYPHPPEACLVNFYSASARMGLHQDRDETDLSAPVVSVSLGDDCLFRVGPPQRNAKTVSLRLQSGDVLVLGGDGRLAYHGVDRIYPDTSTLLRNSGRINLTLRRVTMP